MTRREEARWYPSSPFPQRRLRSRDLLAVKDAKCASPFSAAATFSLRVEAPAPPIALFARTTLMHYKTMCLTDTNARASASSMCRKVNSTSALLCAAESDHCLVARGNT
jgi:hypothetical protein